MKLSPHFILPLLIAAFVAAWFATFGGVKPDLDARELLPNQPANAQNR